MDRRGFLGAISAFAAAVASGVRTPVASPLKADAFIEAVESLPTTARSLQDDLVTAQIAAMKSWGVVEFQEVFDATGCLRRLKVAYRQSSFSTVDRAYVASLVGEMRPVSVVVSWCRGVVQFSVRSRTWLAVSTVQARRFHRHRGVSLMLSPGRLRLRRRGAEDH